MTFYILQATVDGSDLQAGDEIGLFDVDPVTGEEICVGAGVLTQPLSAVDYLEMIASMDDGSNPDQANGFTPGNDIIYRLYNENLGEITSVSSSYPYPGYDELYAAQGTCFAELNGLTTNVQSIELQTGWNLMSFRVQPENWDMLEIVQPLIDDEVLYKVIDEIGGTIFHLPFPPPNGQWSNTIGDMANTEGYYIKVMGNATLPLEGYAVDLPMEITLTEGWNIISYPCENPQNAMEVVQPLIDAGVLYKVIDETGGIIFHLPFPPPNGQWNNSIGNFLNGEGYYIKVTEDAVLTINEPTDGSHTVTPTFSRTPSYFTPCFENNPYQPMAIVVKGASWMETGDEIGIYSDGNCVGAAVYNGDGPISIPVAMDDPTTDFTDGALDGSSFGVNYWKKRDQVLIGEVVFEIISGNEFAEGLATSVISLNPMLTQLEELGETFTVQLKPNPFKTQTVVEIAAPGSVVAELTLYTSMGMKKCMIASNELIHKKSAIVLDKAILGLGSGVYYLKVSLSDPGNRSIIHKTLKCIVM
nr:hypothetical protein [Bacteroidota bacterium]